MENFNYIPIKGLSVIVCCYNSATRLSETLKHLFAQKVSDSIKWEVLIINNASTDNTVSVAQKAYEMSNCNVPFRVIEENKLGLINARLTGLNHSTYEYLVWVDDDNWLKPDYLNAAYQIMEENPQIGILGGTGLPYLETEAPPWFEKYQLSYAIGRQAKFTGEIPKDGFIYGAGAVIRKTAWMYIIKSGFKNILTGRKGPSLLSGEDVEIGNALRLAGYKIWFDEKLIFQHFIPKERLTWNYIMNSSKGCGESSLSSTVFYFIFNHPNINFSKLQLLYYKRLIWLLSEILKHPVTLFEFLFNKRNSKNWNIIEINRQCFNLISSFKNRDIAFTAYHNIIKTKNNLNLSKPRDHFNGSASF